MADESGPLGIEVGDELIPDYQQEDVNKEIDILLQ